MIGAALRQAWRLVRRPAHWPLRLRLVIGFVAAMAVLLAATGAFVYWRVAVDLDTGLDRDLDEGFAALESSIGPDGRVAEPGLPNAAATVRVYQSVTDDGTVLSFGGTDARPLLDADQLARARRGPLHAQLGDLLPGSARPLRLLAGPIAGRPPAAVLIVGVDRDQRDEALRELLATLAIAGFGALVIAAAVGERLAKAALSPVERYRAQAATIAGGATGVRLDVPEGRHDEVTRLGRTFNEVLGALEGALARERRFVNDASHELRTPLTLLSARVQLQRRRPRTVAEHERALAELETDINELIALSNQLLDLGAATDADGPGDADDCAAGAQTEPATAPGTAVGDVIRRVALSEIGATVHVEDDLSPVTVPTGQLRQIVANLVANAATHGRAPIEVSAVQRDRLALIEVHDHGAGMAASFLPVAVERFRRGDDARDRPGSGLGLAVIDAIVRRHHGELRICANGEHHRVTETWPFPCTHAEGGTTITVALPTRER